MNGAPFNSDELAAQILAGGGPRGHGIHDFMPDQHRAFLAQQPCLFVGAIDADGSPLATLLCGRPGFVRSPDAATLHIAALPDAGDPAQEALSPGRDVGILGIDFSTRRRNRINGRITGRDAGGISVAVAQSFGNCPQYIQRREPQLPGPSTDGCANPAESLNHLDGTAQRGHRGGRHFLRRQPFPGRQRRDVRRGYFTPRRSPGLHSRRRRRVDHS